MKILCPTCKGKGHVQDQVMTSMAALTVILLPVALLDNKSLDGFAREICPDCKGCRVITVDLD